MASRARAAGARAPAQGADAAPAPTDGRPTRRHPRAKRDDERMPHSTASRAARGPSNRRSSCSRVARRDRVARLRYRRAAESVRVRAGDVRRPRGAWERASRRGSATSRGCTRSVGPPSGGDLLPRVRGGPAGACPCSASRATSTCYDPEPQPLAPLRRRAASTPSVDVARRSTLRAGIRVTSAALHAAVDLMRVLPPAFALAAAGQRPPHLPDGSRRHHVGRRAAWLSQLGPGERAVAARSWRWLWPRIWRVRA